MTEAEWLACTDPTPMLEFLRDKGSERKLRLFACACCRRIWHLLTDERSRKAVEAAEQFADGEIDVKTLGAAHAAAWPVVTTASDPAYCPGQAALCAAAPQPIRLILYLILYTPVIEGYAANCDLLGDIFGNLFRPVTLDPAWLTWHDGLLVSMAQKMYESRDFSDMAVLADALEEAGCDNADILAHCRQPGEHVRGCWVLDLLLGKE